MDGGTILLIVLGVMFTAITVYAVIARGRERAKAYRNLGLEEQANIGSERAEFLMAAARRETGDREDSLEVAAADISGGGAAGAIIGAVVGGIIGGVPGIYCYTLFVICSPIGGFVGGAIGGVVGSGIGGVVGSGIGGAIQRRLTPDSGDSSGEASAGSDSLGCLGYSGLGCLGAVVGFFSIFFIAAILWQFSDGI